MKRSLWILCGCLLWCGVFPTLACAQEVRVGPPKATPAPPGSAPAATPNGAAGATPNNASAAPPGNTMATQSYAVIDLSGPTATGTTYDIALNDQNQVAFAHSLTVTTWQGGTLNDVATLSLDGPTNVPGGGQVRTEVSAFPKFTPVGATIGEFTEKFVGGGNTELGSIGALFSCHGSQKTEMQWPTPLHVDWKSVLQGRSTPYFEAGVSINDCAVLAGGGPAPGYCGGIAQVTYGATQPYGTFGDSGYAVVGDQIILYGPDLPADVDAANVTTVEAYYVPRFINAKGETAGGGPDENNVAHAYFSNYSPDDAPTQGNAGNPPTDLGVGDVQGLSDDNRVIFVNNDNVGGVPVYHGKLWQSTGTTTDLASLLVGTGFESYQSILPLLISNEDATTHAFSIVTQMDNGSDYQLVLWKYTPQLSPPPAGTLPASPWQLYRIQFPDGVQISWGALQAINASGVIAAIGNAGTGDAHALLLLPTQLQVTNAYSDLASYVPGWNNAYGIDGSTGLISDGDLQSPLFHIAGTVPDIPGLNIKAYIDQDIDTFRCITYDDGSFSICSSTYLADNYPEFDDSVQSVPDHQGKIMLYFNGQPPRYGDAPSFPLTPSAREHVAIVDMILHARDFLTISVNGGPAQIVAQANWLISMSAYFRPDSDPALDSMFLRSSLPPYGTPNNNITIYGRTPTDQMISGSARLNLANAHTSNPANWEPTGPPGSHAQMIQMPLSLVP